MTRALAVCAFFASLIWWIVPAEAHEWYDRDCCSGRDCAAVALDAASLARIVDVGPAGIRIRIEPGDHSVLPHAFGERLFTWDDPQLRQSQDDNWHVCITPHQRPDLGGAHKVLCVYMPPVGF